MKKLMTILALATVATGAFAQGQTSWANFTGLISTNSAVSEFAVGAAAGNATTTGKISGTANSYYFTLLFTTAAAPASHDPKLAGWTQAQIGGVAVTGTNFTGLVGDMQGPKGSGTQLIDNWAAGTAGSFIIVGWSANLGSDWATVLSEYNASWANIAGYSANNNYFFGVSAIGNGTPSSSPSPAYNLWAGAGAPGNALTLNVVAPVPEPATMVLAGLGGLSLLALRRKK